MYADHYGLTGRPFQLTPDPRFYFDSATHKKAMAYLGYGLAQGEGFIVVTGEIGAGKTTLVGHLMDTLNPARVTAVKIVSTQLAGDDVLRMTAQAFGIATEGAEKAQLLERIEQFLQERQRSGRKTLLIVDEVQGLPAQSLEELRMLSNFQAGGQALLQLFLLGQPEFRELLDSAGLDQLRQRVIATHHLEPMQSDEVGPYVEHRMKLVGWAGKPWFTDDAFVALHAASGGIPRKLNTIASRALLMGAIEQSDVIDARLIDAVLADMGAEGLTLDAKAPAPEGFQAHAAAFADPSHALDLAARITMLEAQSEEQGAALRRVLSLLIDWVERDENSGRDTNRASAA
jgi:general secretion pathway protein A